MHDKIKYGQNQSFTTRVLKERGKMDDQKGSNVLCQNIKLNQIQDNLLRLDFFSEAYLEELITSIQKDGLLESLLIHQDSDTGTYTLLNGHYRIRALRRLKIKETICNVMVCDDASATSNYLASFIRKNTVTALEEGHIIVGLTNKGYSITGIAEMWSKSIGWVSRRVKLLKDLDDNVKNELRTGNLFPRVAQELTRLPQGKDQRRVLKLVKDNKLTKDETANLVDRWLIADEGTRQKIEKELSSKDIHPKKGYIASPEIVLKKVVKQCEISLESLAESMEQMRDIRSVWPWEEYLHLCHLFRHISDILEAANSGKETV